MPKRAKEAHTKIGGGLKITPPSKSVEAKLSNYTDPLSLADAMLSKLRRELRVHNQSLHDLAKSYYDKSQPGLSRTSLSLRSWPKTQPSLADGTGRCNTNVPIFLRSPERFAGTQLARECKANQRNSEYPRHAGKLAAHG